MQNESGVLSDRLSDVYDRLAVAAAGGDHEAAAEIFNRLNRFLVWYCSSSDKINKYDLAQDVWVKVFSKIGTYEPRGRFVAWVKKIARNHLVDAVRNSKTSVLSCAENSCNSDYEIESHIDHRADRSLDPEFRETMQICRDAVESVKGLKGECALVHLIHEIPVKDIAKWTGRPEPTIKSRIRLAIDDVRGSLMRKKDSLSILE